MNKDNHPRYSGTLDHAERDEFLPFVHELAAVAMAVVRRHYLQGTAVELKGDDTPVTVADRRAEEVMRLLIAQRYPDHSILGEEHGMERPQARYRWVLDPIDGTKAFVSNCFIFGTLISLVRDGRPILGAIAHPVSGHVLVARAAGRLCWVIGRCACGLARASKTRRCSPPATGRWRRAATAPPSRH